MSIDQDQGPDGRTGLPVGLTLVRASEIYGAEPWFHELTAGIDQVVRPLGHSVLLRVLATREDELMWLRRWHERNSVAAVVLVDLMEGDQRVELVQQIGLPAVAVSSPAVSEGLPTVWTNDAAAVRTAVRALHGFGHESIALVGGPPKLAHSITRAEAFAAVCDELHLTGKLASGDYSADSGSRAFEALLSDEAPPTAVIFDNDLMALGGLAEARRLGVSVPDEVSLVAWDDSALCQLAAPSLSALGHDVQQIGRMVGEAVVAVLSGGQPPAIDAPAIEFVRRESVATPRR